MTNDDEPPRVGKAWTLMEAWGWIVTSTGTFSGGCNPCGADYCPRPNGNKSPTQPRTLTLESWTIQKFLVVPTRILDEFDPPLASDTRFGMRPHEFLDPRTTNSTYFCVGLWKFLSTLLAADVLERLQTTEKGDPFCDLKEFAERLDEFRNMLGYLTEKHSKLQLWASRSEWAGP